MTEAERVEGMRAEIERLLGVIRTQKRDLDDWKLRFRDRDAYCKLLEAELLPYKTPGVLIEFDGEGGVVDRTVEQETML